MSSPSAASSSTTSARTGDPSGRVNAAGAVEVTSRFCSHDWEIPMPHLDGLSAMLRWVRRAAKRTRLETAATQHDDVAPPCEHGSVQPTLALFDAPPVPYRERVIADAADRVSWLRERARGVTATDVARLTGEKSVRAVALEKLLGSRFSGNAYTQHGRTREPEIGRWVARHHPGMRGNTALFHADGQRAHLATPDGIRDNDGTL